MAKKPSNQPESEPLTTAKKAAKSKAAPKAKSSSTTRAQSAAAAKPASPLKTRKKITAVDIELRAYFIAESRQKLGLPGDAASDWLEAERQLKAEASVKPIL